MRATHRCGSPCKQSTGRRGSMSRKMFGTDGIRGLANTHPMTSEVALKVGMAAGKLFTNGEHRHRVVIGKDTRLSGYMIESALVSGFTAVGMDVFQLGPMPTPAVAMLTRSLRADLGVMISASHNPYEDNGIKLFGPGRLQTRPMKPNTKLKNFMERRHDRRSISRARQILDAPNASRAPTPAISNLQNAPLRAKTVKFDGLRIVIDCAQRRRLQSGSA